MNIKMKITREENASYYKVAIGDIVQVDLQTYISGVVASEMGNAQIQAAKAQAIAARTFAYPYYSKHTVITDASSTHQAFRTSRLTNAYYNAKAAANATAGLVLQYGDNIINSCPYSNSNGGRTTSSQQRWGGYRAWLIEQDDPWDKAAHGNGKGHGVGMSQVGCHYAAKLGKTCEEILSFYYPGTKIVPDGISNTNQKGESDMSVSAIDFVEQCKIPLNEKWGYIWGQAGGTWTSSKQAAAVAARGTNWQNTRDYGSKWIGRRVADCSGLLYWAMRQLGGSLYHGANTIWNKWCVRQGKITAGIQLKPGTALFLVDKKNGKDNRHHIGVYVGDGIVIQAKGTRWGVVTSEVSHWDEWGELKGIDYSMVVDEDTGVTSKPIVSSVTTLRKGSNGDLVVKLQTILTDLGYLNDKIDGKFGSKTQAALKAFQSDKGLAADGICGNDTWAALQANTDTIQSDINAKSANAKPVVTSENSVQLEAEQKDEEVPMEYSASDLDELFSMIATQIGSLQKQVMQLQELHNIKGG